MAYLEQNVFPAILEQRKKLELQLSETEKAEIAQLREEFQVFKQKGKEDRMGGKKHRQNMESLSDAEKVALFDQHHQKKKLHQQLREKVNKYESKVNPLLEELHEPMQKWKTDLKALAENNNDEEEPDHSMHPNRHQGGLRRFLSPIHFVLLDPEKGFSQAENTRSSLMYPNPVAGEAQISFSLEKSGNVLVEIVDSQGNVVKTISEKRMEAGANTLTFKTDDLKQGAYFYILQANGKKEVKRFVVK